MPRRWLTSDGTNVQEVQIAKVAVGGVVKNITKACVAESGIVRQFWPALGGDDNATILWDTTPIAVAHSAIDPLDSLAAITFNRTLGQFTYSNFPMGDSTGTYLNPPLDGTAGDDDKFLIRVDQISGTVITGTLATWIDLNSAATLVWALAKTDVGSVSASATISIAQDTGSGTPVSGTIVAKPVSFAAEVTTTSKITWNVTQRDLVEIKESVDADCILTFNPDGTAVGDADTSGAFNDDWHTDTPAVIDPSGFSVKVTLISGTAPTGSALGAALSLDVVREWTLLATSGEDLSCALDVEVDTIPTSTPVVKRVTMNSERTEDSAPPVWNTDEWTLSDVEFKQALSGTVNVAITFKTNGEATGNITNSSGDETQETDDWLPGGEVIADYEVRLTDGAGANTLTSHDFGTWYSLASQQAFLLEYATLPNLRFYTITASVRKIGDLAVDKIININVAGASGGQPL